MRVAILLLLAGLAGCFGGQETGFPYYDPADGLYHYEFDTGSGRLHADFAPGALGKLQNVGDAEITVEVPANHLLVRDLESPSFELPSAVTLAPGTTVWHLSPPGTWVVNLTVDGARVTLDAHDVPGFVPSTKGLLRGENVVDLMKIQEAEYPHREPGHPNYYRAIEYFDQYFADLGYLTEVDPYGTHGLSQGGLVCAAVRGGTVCPESVANVVAWKPGTSDKVIFVAGGHFDMVSGTTHAAFDDTSGTIGTLELARALAPFQFEHTIMFGLWGGEENGLLGSNFWVQTNPLARSQVISYWNLDVIGMSNPAPLPKPDPIVIAAGPDAPNGTSGGGGGPAQQMLAWARTIQQEWMAMPDTITIEGEDQPGFIYEGVASGQVSGYAGVNAQSDHTSFIAAGIPAYFIFNGDALAGDNPVRLHSESDTLTNMSKYSLYAGDFDLDAPWASEADRLAGEAALAQSFETTLWFPFYHAVLVDKGVGPFPLV